jgi:hypothetical protein
MVSLIQTTIGAILGPLVGQVDAQREAEFVVELERENGRLTAEAAGGTDAGARSLSLQVR